jgi:hypothetical protein
METKKPNINDYPTTDSRTFKNPNGTVNWCKYANALDEYILSLSPVDKGEAEITAEEVLRKYVFTEGWNHTEVVAKENALKAMEEYSALRKVEMPNKKTYYL